MNYYPFDSRSNLYRNKFGSLAEGETLRLKLLLHKDAHVYDAYLRIREDADSDFKELRLLPGDWVEDYRGYEGEITLSEGLYWYCFRYTSEYGEFYVTREGESLGIVSRDGECWQQTVYSADFSTPEWLSGGIIYQIFPDRFFASGKQKKNIPQDRYICDDWYKDPEYRQPENKLRLGNDYYGGDLKGIEEKLPYLKSLGVSCIYLNPIFEAHSNHRYNTADYFKIDPSLGDEKDFVSLIKHAEKSGISIILDGVFSHTGEDSIYFNKYNRYDSVGAYNSENSQYSSWYRFENFPDKYSAWWGIKSLPETNEDDLSFSNFITGEDGVIRYWLKKGVKGFRLDVADELTDGILDKIRIAIKSESKENYLLGEVWEDASNKISYGYRRRFLRGKQLDSVMNYPLANAIISYVKGESALGLNNTVLRILENYPKPCVRLLMNHIGTHDTARILTVLGTDKMPPSREEQSCTKLSEEEYKIGVKRLKLASVLQYTLPGVPSVYYGDEAGMTGYGDPFCRAGYPWNEENNELLEHYRFLGEFRRLNPAFKEGDYQPLIVDDNLFAFERKGAENSILVVVNRGFEEREITTPKIFGNEKIKIKPMDFILKSI